MLPILAIAIAASPAADAGTIAVAIDPSGQVVWESAPPEDAMVFANAKKHCAELKSRSRAENWRLPSMEELSGFASASPGVYWAQPWEQVLESCPEGQRYESGECVEGALRRKIHRTYNAVKMPGGERKVMLYAESTFGSRFAKLDLQRVRCVRNARLEERRTFSPTPPWPAQALQGNFIDFESEEELMLTDCDDTAAAGCSPKVEYRRRAEAGAIPLSVLLVGRPTSEIWVRFPNKRGEHVLQIRAVQGDLFCLKPDGKRQRFSRRSP